MIKYDIVQQYLNISNTIYILLLEYNRDKPKVFNRLEGGELMEEYHEDPLEVNLDDIEGKDPKRAEFIRGYLKKATI